MDEQKQAEVVTIGEAVKKVRSWIAEKDFEKAKQGCEEILAVEKDNQEVKNLLEQANQGLGTKTETPTPTSAPVAPISISEAGQAVEVATEQAVKSATEPKKSHIGTIVLLLILLLIIGGFVFAFIKGWLNPAFEWILNILGL